MTKLFQENLNSKGEKCTAANERFGASGGAYSYDTEQVTSLFALVRAAPIPPPLRQAAATLSASGGQCSAIGKRKNKVK